MVSNPASQWFWLEDLSLCWENNCSEAGKSDNVDEVTSVCPAQSGRGLPAGVPRTGLTSWASSPTYMLISNHLTSPQSLPSLHPGKPDQRRLWTSKYHREQDTVTSASVFRLSFSAFQNWKTEFSEFEEGEEAWHGWHHPRSPFGRWMMAHYCQWNQQYSKYSTQIFSRASALASYQS